MKRVLPLLNIVVLLSGQGQTLQAIIDRCAREAGVINIAAVISDKPSSYGLERARRAGIPIHALDRKSFETNELYHAALQKRIEPYLKTPRDLIVLAGYMRILIPSFVNHFAGRIVNIHPSLLPKFPGLHTHARALEAGETEHGTTIHLVIAELDAGPIIAQGRVKIESNDSPQSLEKKVKALEQTLYPDILFQLARGERRLSSKTYFISDLHLSEAHPETTQAFFQFLEMGLKDADSLYLLGDLFEAWIEDCKAPLAMQVSAALKALSMQGLKIYFMRGNRDFLLTQRYAKQCGMNVLSDPTVVSLYGKRVLLMHGDLLCTDDVSYQRFRKRAHNPFFKFLFLSLPLFLRRAIAKRARQKSQMHTQSLDRSIQDVNASAVEDYLRRYDCDLLIHGHTHLPAVHTLSVDGCKATRIVLGAWHGGVGTMLCYDVSGDMTVLEA